MISVTYTRLARSNRILFAQNPELSDIHRFELRVFQLPIHSDSQRYTAFNTCFGTFKFLRLPMGLSSSPSTFQPLMDKVLHGLTFKVCLCYLDDILIASETFDEHIEDINNVFKRLRDAGLKLGPKKCTFARDSCICWVI